MKRIKSKSYRWFVFLGVIATYAGSAVGADAPAGRVTGLLDFRPSYTSKTGELHTENTAAIGYQFNADRAIGYTQYVNSNLYNPQASEEESGLQAKLDVGFVNGKFKNLWQSEAKDLAFSYEARLYTPTSQSAQDAGMITTNRNYLTLKKTFNETFSLSVVELPIFHLYSRSGANGKANPFFENRVYLIADINLTSKLSLSLPLMFHQTRYANFQDGAKNNNSWGYFVYVWPEVTYAIDDTYSVGVSYYSDNLLTSDLAKFTLGDGLEQGVYQLVFTASL